MPRHLVTIHLKPNIEYSTLLWFRAVWPPGRHDFECRSDWQGFAGSQGMPQYRWIAQESILKQKRPPSHVMLENIISHNNQLLKNFSE